MNDFIVLNEYSRIIHYIKNERHCWDRYYYQNGEMQYDDNVCGETAMSEFNDPKNAIFVRKAK